MIETRTIVVSLVVGIVVTLVAALVPALRATRVTPMAALLEAELPESRTARADLHGASPLLLVLDRDRHDLRRPVRRHRRRERGRRARRAAARWPRCFGVSMFSPRLVRPLASICGWPLERLRGITGRLARENTVRKPGRTAVTAGALMIGLAVVVFVTVFAAGISASVGNAIDRNFQGDLVLQNTDGFSPIAGRCRARGREGRRG